MGFTDREKFHICSLILPETRRDAPLSCYLVTNQPIRAIPCSHPNKYIEKKKENPDRDSHPPTRLRREVGATETIQTGNRFVRINKCWSISLNNHSKNPRRESSVPERNASQSSLWLVSLHQCWSLGSSFTCLLSISKH